ncbi:MAG: hypothetical protein Q8O01_07530, partial [Candidatus Omnitrophota bacterium]|nr:hypothetical protein [Candidatus Omnitrophota bacterium]
MFKMNRMVSTIVLVCFLFNTAVSDLAFGQTTNFKPNTDKLAPPLTFGQDMGRIEFILKLHLATAINPDKTVNIDKFKKSVGNYNDSQRQGKVKVDEHETFQVFANEPHQHGSYLRFMFRIYDHHGDRTYHAVFPNSVPEGGDLPIYLYTDEEYRSFETRIKKGEFSKGRIHEPKKAAALQRNVEHQAYDEHVIRWVHKNKSKLIYEVPATEYKDMFVGILQSAKVSLTQGNDKLLMYNKRLVLVARDDEIDARLEKYKLKIIDAQGNAHEVIGYMHTSNDAVHMFLDRSVIDLLVIPDSLKTLGRRGRVLKALEYPLSYEVGAMLEDCLSAEFRKSKDGIIYSGTIKGADIQIMKAALGCQYPVNEIYQRYCDGQEGKQLEYKSYTSIDLDTNFELRDYAAGGVDFVKLSKLIAAELNWPEIDIIVNHHPDIKDRFIAGLMGDNRIIANCSFGLNSKGKVVDLKKSRISVIDSGRHSGLSDFVELGDDAPMTKKFRTQRGKSPDAAKVLIASAEFLQDFRGFCVQDYRETFAEYASLLGFAPTISESQARRYLDALVASGFLNKDESARPYGYILSEDVDEEAKTLKVTQKLLDDNRNKIKVLLQKSKYKKVVEELSAAFQDIKEDGEILGFDDYAIKDRLILNAMVSGLRDSASHFTKFIQSYYYHRMDAVARIYLAENYGIVAQGYEGITGRVGGKPLSSLGGGLSAEQLGRFALSDSTTVEDLVAYLTETGLLAQQVDIIREILGSDARYAVKLERFEALLAKPAIVTPVRKSAEKLRILALSDAVTLGDLVEYLAKTGFLKEDEEIIRNEQVYPPRAIRFERLLMKAKAKAGFVEPAKPAPVPAIVTPSAMAIEQQELAATHTAEMIKPYNPSSDSDYETVGAGLMKLLNALSPEREIITMTSLASEAGLQIPTHPDERYNLLVTSEFFANGDFEEHKAKYGDRFDLDRVSGRSHKQFVDNILAKAVSKETRTIALVPSDLPAEQLERLTKAGIRFMRVNTADLQKAKADRDTNREKFQLDTYAMMILSRRIDNTITADSAIYRLLSFYLKSHFALTDMIVVDDYIMAIVNND